MSFGFSPKECRFAIVVGDGGLAAGPCLLPWIILLAPSVDPKKTPADVAVQRALGISAEGSAPID
jgi:hypothetical protein